ncbi:MAG TPA: DUF4230 domain-containing protein [Sphingomicrobium sp.]|jgi:hypothetical protein|nr:DUF4230 domain-containing protein [Sphingomicrobium sp.]
MDRRLKNLIVASAVAGALLLGLIAGVALKISDRFLRGPDPETVVNSSLESMRAQNRLVPFVARFVAVTSSRQERFGLSAERTLILPGTVRYELDLAKIEREDLDWNSSTKTLSVRLPNIEIAGPEVDLKSAREYGDKGILSAVTNAEERLDNANRSLAIADLRKQAAGPTTMRLAREAARQAVERSFAMPLQAAGIEGAAVEARFADEADDPSYLDTSVTYNEAIAEARRRRAAEGQ